MDDNLKLAMKWGGAILAAYLAYRWLDTNGYIAKWFGSPQVQAQPAAAAAPGSPAPAPEPQQATTNTITYAADPFATEPNPAVKEAYGMVN